MSKAVVDKSKCIGCESCVSVCPVEAISVVSEKAQVDVSKCVECGACVSVCPASAITQK